MIHINKGESKLVVFTLEEKSRLSNSYYIFELESNDTRNKIYFTNDDISPNPDRYNSFTFSEGITGTFSGGFELNIGTFDYSIFESGVTGSVDITGLRCVEKGLLKVNGTGSNYIDYSPIDGGYTYNPE